MAKLTPAQLRLLGEVRAAGVRRYNGRATSMIQALRAAGLVEAELYPHPGRELWVVRAKP